MDYQDQKIIKMSIKEAGAIFAAHFLREDIKVNEVKYLKMIGDQRSTTPVNEIVIVGIVVPKAFEKVEGEQLEILPPVKGRRRGVQECTLPLINMNDIYSIDNLLDLVRKTRGMMSKTWPDGMQSVDWDYFHSYMVGPALKHHLHTEGRGIQILSDDKIRLFYND